MSDPHQILNFYGFSYSYGSGEALQEVSLDLERGKFYAILGPNGSGKSTLLKAMAGLHELGASRVSGQIRFMGTDFMHLSCAERARRVAYLMADLNLDFPLSAGDVVGLGGIHASPGQAPQATQDRIRSAMERTFCWELREREFRTLSGGERQLVALARGLVQAPKVLLLDEALSKMDLNHQQMVGERLREQVKDGQTICLVSHDVNLACELADEAIILAQGKLIAQGPLETVLTKERLALIYPGARLRIIKNSDSGRPHVYFS